MKRRMYWLVINAGFAACVWFGYWQGIDGARNVAQFMVFGLFLPLGLLAMTDQVIESTAKHSPPPVRRYVSHCIGWAALGTFIWQGALITAAAFAVWMVLSAVSRIAAEKRRTSAEATA